MRHRMPLPLNETPSKMLRTILIILAVCVTAPHTSAAQDLQSLLQSHQRLVAKPSAKTVGVVLDDLASSGLSGTADFLEKWRNKDLWVRKEDGRFFYTAMAEAQLTLLDIDTGQVVGTTSKKHLKQIRPNGGVRKAIASALVQFQLNDPDITRRKAAVDAIARAMTADQLAPLEAAIDNEADADLKAQKMRLAVMLRASFAPTTEARLAAITALSDDISVDTRAVLNQILTTKRHAAVSIPSDLNVATQLMVGKDISSLDAYAMLVDANLAQPRVKASDIVSVLSANIENGRVAGTPVRLLDTIEAREKAYDSLAAAGAAPTRITDAAAQRLIETHVFFDSYSESDIRVTAAAKLALDGIETRVAISHAADLTLDALSLASIYFLAAIGLAVTFGVMGVINMAHGEFIMMGAYTGYVVQLFVPNYTLSIIVALPLAFAVTFAAGVALERLVIRWLYHRPLETLLATFGISIALQQLAKNIFGTQARPLTSPAWLDGAWVINDVIAISYIRIAIFVLAIIFLSLIVWILRKTRLGLEMRAVTQNPGMAASMGINPDRINMLTFGLGSGIAGIAGVAIGLYAKVTSEMGADYIVQSFMTVVVGGVGNVWGTLAGATMIGFLQKGIEWFNPSNTLAAQTYMILFIILFIQFRPKGIVALRGRAAGD